MTWLWIAGVLLVLLLFLLIRVGVHVELKSGALTVNAKVGPVSFRVYPAKPKEEKAKEAKEEPEKPVAEKKKAKFTFVDLKDAARALWPPLKRALARTRRGIRIHPLTVSLTVGAAEDPADGAQKYGYLHAGVWTFMPVLEQLLVIPAPSIHVGIDFDTGETTVEGEVGLSARIGTLLCVALTIGIPALKWFLSRNKAMKRSLPPQAEKTKTAA